jgi:hypothetical protein
LYRLQIVLLEVGQARSERICEQSWPVFVQLISISAKDNSTKPLQDGPMRWRLIEAFEGTHNVVETSLTVDW